MMKVLEIKQFNAARDAWTAQRRVISLISLTAICFGDFGARHGAFQLVNGTDEPDETSVRALRPKTSCLTLDVTETLSCYSQSARTILGHMQHDCFVTLARPRFVRFGLRFGGRFEDRRFAGEGV